jgi:hypothetical protein
MPAFFYSVFHQHWYSQEKAIMLIFKRLLRARGEGRNG